MKRFAGFASVILVVVSAAASWAQPPDLLGGGGKPDVGPLSGLTGRLSATLGGGKAASTATAATHFTPSGKRLSMDTFISGLTKDPEQQKALRQVLTQIFTAYEAEAKKSGFENDVAGALAFYITAHYSIFHGGQEVPDATTLAVARQLQGALNTPAMRQASNADKQRLYEFCVMLAGFTTVSYAAPDTDAKTREGLKTLAGQALTYILKVAPERISLADDGLHITGDTAAVAEAPASQPGPTTAPAKGGKTSSLADISYTVPTGWSEDKGATSITLSHAVNDFYNKRSIRVIMTAGYPRTGSLQDAFRTAWKDIVEVSMVGTDGRPADLRAYVRRLPSGMNCCFDQFTMQIRNGNGQIDVALYLIENGDMVYPIIVMATGTWYDYFDALDGFVGGYRVRGMVPARPLATVKQLAGTWNTSSTSIASRVTSSGNYAGDASIATSETLELHSDGTYSSGFFGYNSGATLRQKTAGTFKIDGDLLIMSAKDGHVTKMQFLGIRKAEDGKTQMLLLTPGTKLTMPNIGLYGAKYILKTN